MTTTVNAVAPVAEQAAGVGGTSPRFKTTVDRKALLEAGNGVAASLPARPAAPVLSGIVLEASDGHLTLSAWDFNHATRDRIPAETTAPGRLLVHGRLLRDLLKKLDADWVTLFADGSKLIVPDPPATPFRPCRSRTVRSSPSSLRAAAGLMPRRWWPPSSWSSSRQGVTTQSRC